MLKKDPKLELQLSGSDVIVEEEIEFQNSKPVNDFMFDPDQVEQIMESIMDLAWQDEDLKKGNNPCYVIKTDKKSEWLFSVSKKCFVEVRNMTEIMSVDYASPNTSYCIINQDLFEVDNDIVYCLGWN